MAPLMTQNNNSLSSVHSRDKTLPPEPTCLLEAKSLRRKNFKLLSLAPGLVADSVGAAANGEARDLREPRLAREMGAGVTTNAAPTARVAPTSRTHPNKRTTAAGSTASASHTGHAPNHAGAPDGARASPTHSDLRPVPPSLGDRRDRTRPAPLLNLDKPAAPVALIDQFSDMKLRPGKKRQTVISSISPTKSSPSAGSPQQPQPVVFALASPMTTTLAIQLNSSDLMTLRLLGRGNSGDVSKILHVPTQRTMAKKVIHIELKLVIQTQIIRELKIMHECRSPYIIDFYGAFIDANSTIVLCMEYCNCGLLDKIAAIGRFPHVVVKKLAFAILLGLTYLYSTHKILHRDIKPSNVLMTHRGDFKLCDFGVLRELTNSLAVADTFVGTLSYMSPERIQGLNYGIKSDVWLLGLMLLELASGRPVWTDEEDGLVLGPEGILDLLQRIVNETPPTLRGRVDPATGDAYDPDLVEFVDLCLVKDEARRKLPWELLEQSRFLAQVKEGAYDREVKAWAKGIRKAQQC